MDRRQALKTGLVLIATATSASIYRPVQARTYTGGTVWTSPLLARPQAVAAGSRVFFTQAEAGLLRAIHNRLIPADELGMSAVDAGCVTFVDHQLAGPYGRAATSYKLGPYRKGTPEQGNQSPLTPAEIYRRGLAEFDVQCRRHSGGAFASLPAGQQDAFLEAMEVGRVPFESVDSNAFFALLLQNVKEGYLADPVYGGNKDMVGWKMIGFPGARYDYRDYLDRIGKVIHIEPVSLLGRPA